MNAKENTWDDANLSPTRRRRLAAGVLKQAASDLRRFHGATTRSGRELYLDAYDWVTADEFSWPYSFLNVCQALNLPPETVREEVMSDRSLGAFRYWTCRTSRAARRLRELLQQVFMDDQQKDETDKSFPAQPSTPIFAYETVH